jgi:ribosomal protein S18 acetylase RimI-like enzyme
MREARRGLGQPLGPPSPKYQWRAELRPEDPEKIRNLVIATGFFSVDEIEIAEELPRERLEKGIGSGYDFVLVDVGGRLVGYACFGHVAGTDATWDLYWIAVDPDCQGKGLGAAILYEAELAMAQAGARKIVAETSTTETYALTRQFYAKSGFALAAELQDYYRIGDGMAIYIKDISMQTG